LAASAVAQVSACPTIVRGAASLRVQEERDDTV
jgi:hypothetical protein